LAVCWKSSLNVQLCSREFGPPCGIPQSEVFRKKRYVISRKFLIKHAPSLFFPFSRSIPGFPWVTGWFLVDTVISICLLSRPYSKCGRARCQPSSGLIRGVTQVAM
jgi:hypothetical protein